MRIPLLFTLLFCTEISAKEIYYECFKSASERYGVDKVLLLAIAKTESNFRLDAINRNNDGSEDYGIMQVNSWWLNKLSKFGITKAHLLSNACTNIHTGAWILADNFHRNGQNWEAVGGYNAGFKKTEKRDELRRIYAEKVFLNYEKVKSGRL